MIDYNEDTLAYTVEFDELYVCWDDEPEDEEICERTAGDLRKTYLANINKIAETIKPELVETYGDEVSGMSNDQIIKNSGNLRFILIPVRWIMWNRNSMMYTLSVLNLMMTSAVSTTSQLTVRQKNISTH